MTLKTITILLQRILQSRKHFRACPLHLQQRSVWNAVVGLEIHAQILTASKLFAASSTAFGNPVNSCVSLFDAAIPGTLPVLNRKCVESAILTALALNCEVNHVSSFDRKHYFYADLPAGYQITQQRSPLAKNGLIEFLVSTPGVHKKPYPKTSRIKQIQLEQDSGKSLHDNLYQRSLIDLNRAGIPLMELVFEPDLTDGEEAASLVKELILILSRIKTCSCKMEEGALRVDANISVNRKGESLGTRTEIKNIGSVRGVAKAINYEITRQIAELEKGYSIVNETRAWDTVSSTTLPMRDKEVNQDYRFMPEPNLPPLRLSKGGGDNKDGLVNVEEVKKSLPELPDDTRRRLKKEYNLPPDLAAQIVSDDELLHYFMELMKKKSRDGRLVGNILTKEILTLENNGTASLNFWSTKLFSLGEVIDMLQTGHINLIIAKKLLEIIAGGNPLKPSQVVNMNKWSQIRDKTELERLCREAVEKNPQILAKYKEGKLKVFSALVGFVAKSSDNRADLKEATRILKDIVDNVDSNKKS